MSFESSDFDGALDRANAHARYWLRAEPDRLIPPVGEAGAVADALGGPMPEEPMDPAALIDLLARHVEPGLISMGSGWFFGWVTGGTLPARQQVLVDVGWDLDNVGLTGAPRITVLAGADRHSSVDVALRHLGRGATALVPADDQGRIRPEALAEGIGSIPGTVVLNDVLFSQVSVSFGSDEQTRAVTGRLLSDGVS